MKPYAPVEFQVYIFKGSRTTKEPSFKSKFLSTYCKVIRYVLIALTETKQI